MHQIWARHIETRRVGPFTGRGYEGIVDDSVGEAMYAQQSGPAICNNFLFVTDNEVTAIRRIDLGREPVQTAVGEGLFVVGHKDWPLDKSRLTHPLGIACEGKMIYVADTYNHAIRVIDLGKQ